MNKTLFELSVDTDELIRALEAVETGNVISWNELSEHIGRNVRVEAYSNLTSARRHLLSSGVCFETIVGVGLKRQTIKEVVKAIVPDTTKKVRSVVRRQKKKLNTISEEVYRALDKQDQVLHNTARALLGTLAEFTKPTSVSRVEAATKDAGKALPLAQALKAFVKPS